MRIATAVFSLALLFKLASADEGSFRADRVETFYTRGKLAKRFLGNVEAIYDGVTIRSHEAAYFEYQGEVRFVGQVSAEDSSRTLTADRIVYLIEEKKAIADGGVFLSDSERGLRADSIIYFREEKRATAQGDVELVDSESRTKITGGEAEYDGLEEIGFFSDSPRLVRTDADGEGHIDIIGQRIKLYLKERKALIEDDVHIIKGEMEAFCGEALYLEGEERFILRGGPKVSYVSEEGTRKNEVSGQEIQITLKDNAATKVLALGDAIGELISFDSVRSMSKLSGGRIAFELEAGRLGQVVVEENAVGLYRGGDDSRPSRIGGRRMTIKLEDEEPREVIAEGNATGLFYLPKGKGSREGMSKVSGDSIRLLLEGGKMHQVLIQGGAQGAYHPSRKELTR